MNQPGSTIQQQGKTPFVETIELGPCAVLLDRERGTLQIPALKSGQQITFPTEELLKAAAFFLSQPIVRERYPHAALPLQEVQHPSWILGFVVRGALDTLSQTYSNRFGTPDQDGVDSLFRSQRSLTTKVSWGEGAITVAVDRNRSEVALQGLQEIPLEMMVDIFVALLRDPYTEKAFPNYSAPYLRRWGENAFTVTRLREGVPASLTSDTPVPKVKTPSYFDETTPSVSDVPVPQVVPLSLAMPAVEPGSKSPSRAAKQRTGSYTQGEAALEVRASEIAAREEAVSQRESSVTIAQEQLAADRAQLEKLREEIELERDAARAESESANHRLQEAQAALTAAQAEREKTEAIREEISTMLQKQIIDATQD